MAPLRRERTSRRWSSSFAPRVVQQFRQTGDEEWLELIARAPAAVAVVDARFLLESLSDSYWRGRVLEALLQTDRALAYSLAPRFPREFAHAVGRANDSEAADLLEALLAANAQNIDFLALYAYALGRLGRREELDRLAHHIEQSLEQPPEELSV